MLSFEGRVFVQGRCAGSSLACLLALCRGQADLARVLACVGSDSLSLSLSLAFLRSLPAFLRSFFLLSIGVTS